MFLFLRLISIAEAHGDPESFLLRKDSARPDCLNVLRDQTLHIHVGFPVMDAEKINPVWFVIST